jgi:hypothetical protein
MLTCTHIASSEAKVLDLGLHIRRSLRSSYAMLGDLERSYYGGDNYDAEKANGSVRAGRTVGAFLPSQEHECEQER